MILDFMRRTEQILESVKDWLDEEGKLLYNNYIILYKFLDRFQNLFRSPHKIKVFAVDLRGFHFISLPDLEQARLGDSAIVVVDAAH